MKPYMFALMWTILGGSACAGTMDAILANTVTTEDEYGVIRWTFNADGGYTMTLSNGQTLSGTYTSDTAHFCIMPGDGEQYCGSALPEGKGVGDTWQAQNAEGHAVTTSIVAGR